MKKSVLLARAGITAALYVVLTVVFGPLAYGPLQIRPSEALCLLPLLFPESVFGLFVGCMLANLFSGYGIIDIVLGSLTTLLAAGVTFATGKYLKKTPLKLVLGGLPPVLFNAAVIPVVMIVGGSTEGYFSLVFPFLLTQAVWVYALGIPLYFGIVKFVKNRTAVNAKAEIRLARPDELDAVSALYDRVKSALYTEGNPPCWDKDYPSRRSAEQWINSGALHVLELDGRLIGCFAMDKRFDDGYSNIEWSRQISADKLFTFHALMLDSDFRGKGYLRKMLDFICEKAVAEGGVGLRIDTTKTNLRAKAAYEHYGFECVGLYDLGRQLDTINDFYVLELYFDAPKQKSEEANKNHAKVEG